MLNYAEYPGMRLAVVAMFDGAFSAVSAGIAYFLVLLYLQSLNKIFVPLGKNAESGRLLLAAQQRKIR